MRTAALYDIHGNIFALEAVLAEIDQEGIQRIVVGGDVTYGPFVELTLNRLLALGDRAVWIRGNADRELVHYVDSGQVDPGTPEDILQGLHWDAQRITPRQRDHLAALPPRRTIQVEGLGAVLFCHGSPRSDSEILTTLTSEHRLGPIFQGVSEQVVVCGHTHVQFDRRFQQIRLVNAGSVGMAYDQPAACWAMLDSEITFRTTPYDLDRAVDATLASGHPLAASFVETMRQPPGAAETSAFFERMAIQQQEAKP